MLGNAVDLRETDEENLIYLWLRSVIGARCWCICDETRSQGVMYALADNTCYPHPIYRVARFVDIHKLFSFIISYKTKKVWFYFIFLNNKRFLSFFFFFQKEKIFHAVWCRIKWASWICKFCLYQRAKASQSLSGFSQEHDPLHFALFCLFVRHCACFALREKSFALWKPPLLFPQHLYSPFQQPTIYSQKAVTLFTYFLSILQ